MWFESILPQLWVCVAIAMMSSCVSITITQQEIFRGFRTWVQKKNEWLGYLFSCFYCFSHWVVFPAVFMYQPRILQSNYWALDLIVTAFFTVALCVLFSGVILAVMRVAIAKAGEEMALKKAGCLGFVAHSYLFVCRSDR